MGGRGAAGGGSRVSRSASGGGARYDAATREITSLKAGDIRAAGGQYTVHVGGTVGDLTFVKSGSYYNVVQGTRSFDTSLPGLGTNESGYYHATLSEAKRSAQRFISRAKSGEDMRSSSMLSDTEYRNRRRDGKRYWWD